MAMRTLFLGSAGFLLNNFVFAPTSTSTRRLHPFGQGGPWSEEDADLTSAVVISLSASSKTGRSFAWELARDRDVAVHGPLALLQLTSVPGCVPQHPKASLPIMAARYDELERGMDWVASFRPSRVVIVDFGAAESVSESLAAAANKMDVAVSVIGVGSEAKVYSESELLGRVERSKRLGKVQLNTGALLDRALEVEAPGKFMSKMDDAWRRCYEEGGFGDIELTFYRGVKGPRGIEGAWTDLCSQRVGPNVGIVVQLSGDE
ncbi:hypothetical protein N656DRAFT_784077 [Canariomyces notabilis]|uniref:Uncharacterized protein n=1 Tax=Canariomyces notabilis TaxID=2074819 RepID=A0AAN6T929_9PEZI|nr:hypothetical protein N656DRAFT_784077 [Canariomyces arenarius]